MPPRHAGKIRDYPVPSLILAGVPTFSLGWVHYSLKHFKFNSPLATSTPTAATMAPAAAVHGPVCSVYIYYVCVVHICMTPLHKLLIRKLQWSRAGIRAKLRHTAPHIPEAHPGHETHTPAYAPQPRTIHTLQGVLHTRAQHLELQFSHIHILCVCCAYLYDSTVGPGGKCPWRPAAVLRACIFGSPISDA